MATTRSNPTTNYSLQHNPNLYKSNTNGKAVLTPKIVSGEVSTKVKFRGVGREQQNVMNDLESEGVFCGRDLFLLGKPTCRLPAGQMYGFIVIAICRGKYTAKRFNMFGEGVPQGKYFSFVGSEK